MGVFLVWYGGYTINNKPAEFKFCTKGKNEKTAKSLVRTAYGEGYWIEPLDPDSVESDLRMGALPEDFDPDKCLIILSKPKT